MSENLNNKTCGECKHHDKYSCLQLKNVVYIASTHLACIRFCPKKPTNGDKVIAGGIKELVKFHLLGTCDTCIYYNKEHTSHNDICLCPKDKTCADGIEAWLNAPAESEGEDEMR